jgi:hypothetical protein
MEVRLLQNLAMELKYLDHSHFAMCKVLTTLSVTFQVLSAFS